MFDQIENIRDLVASGDTEDAITNLLQLVNFFPKLRNQVLLLSSRLSKENMNRRLGLSFNNQELVQIEFGTLDILDEMEGNVKFKIKSIKLEIDEKSIASRYSSKEKNMKDIRPLLDDMKNILIEIFLNAEVEIIKLKVSVLDEHFQFWEIILSDESKKRCNDKLVLSKIFYFFYLNELNVLNFSYDLDYITLNTYIYENRISFFKVKRKL
jgi:hypothetical protein